MWKDEKEEKKKAEKNFCEDGAYHHDDSMLCNAVSDAYRAHSHELFYVCFRDFIQLRTGFCNDRYRRKNLYLRKSESEIYSGYGFFQPVHYRFVQEPVIFV